MSAASEFAGLGAFGGEGGDPANGLRPAPEAGVCKRGADGTAAAPGGHDAVERPAPSLADGGCRIANAPLIEIDPVPAEEGYLRFHERRPADFSAGKRVLIYGIAGAFVDRPTARLRSYRRLAAQMSGAGIDEVWCVAIHKPIVLGLWSVDLPPLENFRVLCDETGLWTRESGVADARPRPDGATAALEYSLLVSDGAVLRASWRAE